MSRYQHIGVDYKEIEVGDEFMLVNCHRWRDTTYHGPYPCTKVTKTQFTVTPPEGKGANFMRSYGRQVGHSGGPYAKPASPELLEEQATAIKAAADKKTEETTVAAIHERKMRERYGAQHIDCEESQKVLSQVRQTAEVGRSMVKGFFKDIKKTSWKEPYNIMRESERFEETLKCGLILKDRAEELHERMCEVYEAWENGKAITVRSDYDSRVTYQADDIPAVALMRAVVNSTRRRLETEFFSFRYDAREAEWEATFIKRSR